MIGAKAPRLFQPLAPWSSTSDNGHIGTLRPVLALNRSVSASCAHDAAALSDIAQTAIIVFT